MRVNYNGLSNLPTSSHPSVDISCQQFKTLKEVIRQNILKFKEKIYLLWKILRKVQKWFLEDDRKLDINIEQIKIKVSYTNELGKRLKKQNKLRIEKIKKPTQIAEDVEKLQQKRIIEAQYVKQFAELIFFVLTGQPNFAIKMGDKQLTNPTNGVQFFSESMSQTSFEQRQLIQVIFKMALKQRYQQRLTLSLLLSKIEQIVFPNKVQVVVIEANITVGRLVEVQKKNTYPYNCIGLIRANYPRIGLSILGTGVLISSNLVLTSAHNLFQEGYQQRNLTFQLFKGENQKKYKAKAVMCSRYYKQQADEADEKLTNDFALIKLSQHIRLQKYIQFMVLDHFTQEISVFGFICGLNKESYFVGSVGYIIDRTKELLVYQIDSGPGMSGSPIFVSKDNQLHVVGIHTRSIRQGEALSKRGVKINKSKIEELNILIAEQGIKAKLKKSSSNSYYVHGQIENGKNTRKEIHFIFKKIKYYEKFKEFSKAIKEYSRLQEMLNNKPQQLLYIKYLKANCYKKYGYLQQSSIQYQKSINLLNQVKADPKHNIIYKSIHKIIQKHQSLMLLKSVSFNKVQQGSKQQNQIKKDPEQLIFEQLLQKLDIQQQLIIERRSSIKQIKRLNSKQIIELVLRKQSKQQKLCKKTEYLDFEEARESSCKEPPDKDLPRNSSIAEQEKKAVDYQRMLT